MQLIAIINNKVHGSIGHSDKGKKKYYGKHKLATTTLVHPTIPFTTFLLLHPGMSILLDRLVNSTSSSHYQRVCVCVCVCTSIGVKPTITYDCPTIPVSKWSSNNVDIIYHTSLPIYSGMNWEFTAVIPDIVKNICDRLQENRA